MVGVVADDLTGAAELAAVGWRYGLRAEVLVKGTSGPSGATETDLICYDTDSRFCSASEAARRSAAAAAWLRHAGAEWIYKKVDSVLRGQVTAEVLAVMHELKFESALLAPANPGLGRTIRDGRYFVRRRPIDQTEFAADPEYPRLSANVLELITNPENVPICIRGVGEPLSAAGIVICEVADHDDLEAWAARCGSHRLVAGGAEFFKAIMIARKLNREAPKRGQQVLERLSKSSGRELFICGSMSEAARAFVQLARERGTRIFSLPTDLVKGIEFSPTAATALAEQVLEAFKSQRRLILHVGLPPITDRSRARALAMHLVQVAEIVLCRASVPNIYVEGGATAAELVRRMGWHRLVLVHEVAPGVATLAVEGFPDRVVTLKPGAYSWPEQIQNEP
jgi:uncharacterized protein YgbK (DUF1537 family)